MKKFSIVVLLFAVISMFFVISSCSKQDKENSKLSLEKVSELSKKGNELSWEDFEKYDGKEIGSGLYILHYNIDENYYLLIGSGSIEEKPIYIRLVRTNNTDDYIDIRTDNVDSFVSK